MVVEQSCLPLACDKASLRRLARNVSITRCNYRLPIPVQGGRHAFANGIWLSAHDVKRPSSLNYCMPIVLTDCMTIIYCPET
jgi:hypothetical protein